MAESRPLSEEERSELVAYLDGELDAEAARAVEARLNLDPRARTEAESLRTTWAMLDYLPRPEPSAGFTSQTLERVSALGPVPAQPPAPSRRRTLVFRLGWAAAVLLAAMIGFAGVRSHVRRERAAIPVTEPIDIDQQLVRDLRLIENKRLYEQVDDIDFLRKLDDADLFGDDS
jgi:anti-sigma factor RsiW